MLLASAVGAWLCLLAIASWRPADDLAARRRFLIRVLDQGARGWNPYNDRGALYAAEWDLGTYSMASFALANMAIIDPSSAPEAREAVARWIEHLLARPAWEFDLKAWGESPLDPRTLAHARGHAGYYGHLNLMLACHALLDKDSRFKPLLRTLSDALARRMRSRRSRHFETYPGRTYPPDVAVVAASLAGAQLALGISYENLLKEYVAACRLLEDEDGLLPFQLDSATDLRLQPGRGSSSGWNSMFLPLVDPTYAAEQYASYRRRLGWRLGPLAAFREWPDGAWFKADMDTGPVLFSFGGTATGCGTAGARWAGDAALERGLIRMVEIAGVSMSRGGERRYLAVPPVGDALMLAARTATPWRRLWD